MNTVYLYYIFNTNIQNTIAIKHVRAYVTIVKINIAIINFSDNIYRYDHYVIQKS